MTHSFCTPLPTPKEIARWDQASIDEIGIKNEMLMENACREALVVLTTETGSVRDKNVLLFAGPGNNGGDSIGLARHLLDQGANVLVLHSVPKRTYRGVSGYHLLLARKTGVPMRFLTVTPPPLPRHIDIIVDGLLGTGFKGELRPHFQSWIEQLNTLGKNAFVFALDIPSGLNGLTGAPSPIAVRAHATVTFEAAKVGLVMPGADNFTGKLHVRSIGIPRLVKKKYPATCSLLTPEVSNLLPSDKPDMHKGSTGHVLVVGGSTGLTGAPLLAALGALRAGAGLASVACPSSLAADVKAGFPEIMTLPLGEDDAWDASCAHQLKNSLHQFAAVVLGPGIGRKNGVRNFLREFLALERPPCVIDADALYWLAEDASLLQYLTDKDVLTPHPGEMARLLDPTAQNAKKIQKDRFLAATKCLKQFTKSTAILKGAGTLIAHGTKRFISPFSTPTLAVGGSGDVLAGVVGALLARKLSPLRAACLGVYWHGFTGEYLRREYPNRGNLARDIANALPLAMKELRI